MTTKLLTNSNNQAQRAYVALINIVEIARNIVNSSLSRRRATFDPHRLARILSVLVARRCEPTDTTAVSRDIDTIISSQGNIVTTTINMLGKTLPLNGTQKIRERNLAHRLYPSDYEQVTTWITDGTFQKDLIELRQFIQANDIVPCNITFPRGHAPSMSIRVEASAITSQTTTIPQDICDLSVSIISINKVKGKDGKEEEVEVTTQALKYPHTVSWDEIRIRNSSESEEIRTVAQAHSFLFPLWLPSIDSAIDDPDGLDIQLGTVVSIELDDPNQLKTLTGVAFNIVYGETVSRMVYTQSELEPVGRTSHPHVETPTSGIPSTGLNVQSLQQPSSGDPGPRPISGVQQYYTPSIAPRPTRNLPKGKKPSSRDVRTQALSHDGLSSVTQNDIMLAIAILKLIKSGKH